MPVRVEDCLELAHRLVELWAEDDFVQFGALQAVAVLAGHHAAESMGQLGGGIGHFLHHLDAFGALQVDERANVEAPGGRMRVIGGGGAMLSAHLLDRTDELG